jgi:hypothetical protein
MRTCLTKNVDKKKQWSIVTAILYGFGILTTLGNFWITPETILITSGNGKLTAYQIDTKVSAKQIPGQFT